MADELGYRPDPILSALNAYRTSLRPPNFRGNLAILTNWSTPDGWTESGTQFKNYLIGATACAERLGYNLEPFWLREQGCNSKRIESILTTRGIEGVIIAPQERGRSHLRISLTKFSAVGLGYSTVAPKAHIVTSAQGPNMRHLLRELKQLGYKNPGLCLPSVVDQRTDQNWSGAFLSSVLMARPERIAPVLVRPNLTKKVFFNWFDKHRPDVIVVQNYQYEILEWCADRGIEVPGDLGIAMLTVAETEKFSGIVENSQGVGEAAVNLLVGEIQRGARGVPSSILHVLVEGFWTPGETVRKSQPG